MNTNHYKKYRFFIIGSGVAGIYVFPLIYLLLKQVSFLATEYVFVGYRFGIALSMLFGEFDRIYAVQGISSSILQTWVAWGIYFWHGNQSISGALFDLYTYLVLGIPFVAGAVLLLLVWISETMTLSDKALFSLAAMIPAYGAGPSLPLYFAPDYWNFEFVYFMATAFIFIHLLRMSSAGVPSRIVHSHATFIFLGFWTAVGLLLKAPAVSMVSQLALVMLLGYSRWTEVASRARFGLVAIAAFAASVVVLLLLYSNFHISLAVAVLKSFVYFLGHPDPTNQYGSILEIMQKNVGLTVLLLVVIVSFALLIWSRLTQRDTHFDGVRSMLLVGSVIMFAGYFYLILHRPTDTSLFSFQSFLIFTPAVIAASIGTIASRAITLLFFLGFVVGGTMTDWGNLRNWYSQWGNTQVTQDATKAIDAAFRYSMSLNSRGRYLYVTPGGHSQSIEETLLVHSLLGSGGPVTVDSSGLPKNRPPSKMATALLGDVTLIDSDQGGAEMVTTAIRQGGVVIWTENEHYLTSRELPEIKALVQNPRAVIRTFAHNALGSTRWIYIGYLNI